MESVARKKPPHFYFQPRRNRCTDIVSERAGFASVPISFSTSSEVNHGAHPSPPRPRRKSLTSKAASVRKSLAKPKNAQRCIQNDCNGKAIRLVWLPADKKLIAEHQKRPVEITGSNVLKGLRQIYQRRHSARNLAAGEHAFANLATAEKTRTLSGGSAKGDFFVLGQPIVFSQFLKAHH